MRIEVGQESGRHVCFVGHKDSPEQQFIKHWESNIDFLEEPSQIQYSAVCIGVSKNLQINQVIAIGMESTLDGFQVAGSDLSTLFLSLTTLRNSAEKDRALDTTWNTRVKMGSYHAFALPVRCAGEVFMEDSIIVRDGGADDM